jgi:hypothetical protein
MCGGGFGLGAWMRLKRIYIWKERREKNANLTDLGGFAGAKVSAKGLKS